MKYFLCVLGMVFVIEGLPYFAFPAHIKAYLLRMAEVSDKALRVLGAVALLTGLMLIYFGTS
jgi:uncharacterized protein YjeT (DUF2065 family)